MESSKIELVLNYGMDTFAINPPSSFSSLVDIAKEKYDLTIINRFVYYDEGEEIKLTNDSELLKLLDYIDTNDLKEIDIIIKSDESKSKRKKSTSLRKRSSAFKPPVSTGSAQGDDGVNGISV